MPGATDDSAASPKDREGSRAGPPSSKRLQGEMMSFPSVETQMNLLQRGCEGIYSVDELRQKLRKSREQGRPLRIKLGLDPTAPDIHLGHTVVLRKMRQFQDLGHRAVLIIGDFTARIGDPSGKSKTRPVLDQPTIKANAQTYVQQADRVLDTSPDKLEVRNNSEWLAGMDLADVLRLTSTMTVAQMLQRENFKKRMADESDIVMTELMYPLMQGYDSAMIDADVELGGTDQTFNNLVGRDLMARYDKPRQVVMIMPILRGLDGVEKMSKSLGNYVGLTDTPKDMFGKTMRIDDEMMREWFTLLTDVPADEIETQLDASRTHPRDAKFRLANELVTLYHDRESADREQELWHKEMREGQLRDDIPERVVSTDTVLPGDDGNNCYLFDRASLVVQCQFASSNSEARRLMAQNGIRLNGSVLKPDNDAIEIRPGDVLQRGKRQAVRLKPERRNSQEA